MKKPAQVTLTVVATMSFAAHGQQAAPNPCSSPTFNGSACQAAIREHGFCSQGNWISTPYHEKYPYFYDRYQQWIAAGGVVDPAPDGSCPHPHRGGFGATGAYHAHHGG
jgi:hypothetical protein